MVFNSSTELIKESIKNYCMQSTATKSAAVFYLLNLFYMWHIPFNNSFQINSVFIAEPIFQLYRFYSSN